MTLDGHMDKSGVVLGSILGATAVLIVFAFVIIPPTGIEPPSPKELILSNGHEVSTVGEITPLPQKKGLSLIQIFLSNPNKALLELMFKEKLIF